MRPIMEFRYVKLVIIFIILIQSDGTFSLLMLDVRVPKNVERNGTATLECNYDLEGDTLYAIKWFKDRNEFYRYLPSELPKIKVFINRSFKVDIHKSNDRNVTLKSIDKSSSGRYDCEVTTDAPSFDVAFAHGYMTVVDPVEIEVKIGPA